MRIIKIILLILSLPVVLWAAPAITPGSLSGTMTSGESVSISGSGFGAKSTAAPIKWDNFETNNGATPNDGDTIGNGWTPYGYVTQYETDNNRTGSTFCYKGYMRNEGDPPELSNSRIYLSGLNLTRVYVTYWMRFNMGNLTNAGQLKHALRIGNLLQNSTVMVYTTVWGQAGNPYCPIVGNTDKYFATGGMYPFDTWIQIEQQLDIGTAGNADGTLEYWRGQASGAMLKVLNYQSNIMMKPAGVSDNWIYVFLYNYVGNELNAYTTLYFDDFYIDSTWQRVVLGDSATYTSCTKREIQIPTAWTDTGITFTVNQGSFSAEDTAYLYVVDADGAVSSAYEVTIGSGSSPTTPTITNGGFRSGGIR